MSDVQDAATTVFTDVELRTQAARAEVARLSLAVRTARRDAEHAEREAADLDRLTRNAEAVLQASLEDLLDARRSACEQDLAEERAAATRVVADARDEAERFAAAHAAEESAAHDEARRRAQADQGLPATPAPPVRFRLVAGGGTAEPAHHPAFSAHEPAAEAPTGAPAIEPAAEAASLATHLGVDMAVLCADELHELVRGAVVTGLREAMEQAAAMMHLAPPIARQASPAVRPGRERVVEDAVDGPPFRRRFLHLDVLLPLVAALIVVVLFVAWIG